jgi:DsbC/DsbD-like thiol-disulfide interchange protein/cytochrome c biogenesis protein CcdA
LNYRAFGVKARMQGLRPSRKDCKAWSLTLMHRYRLLVAVLLQCFALVLAQPAQAANHIAAELAAEGAAVPGKSVTLAIFMRPEPGWHGYWLNPGDAGLGMTLEWRLARGFEAGKPLYPVPDTLLIAGLMNHVYAHDYAVLVPLKVPASARTGSTVPVEVHAAWLACTEQICVPNDAVLRTDVKVSAAAAELASRDPRFDTWRRQLPAPLGSPAHFALEGGRVRLAIPLPASVALEAPHLFVADDRVVDYAAPQIMSRKGDMLIVELPRARFAPVTPSALSGLLRLNRAGDGLTVAAVPGEVPKGGTLVADGVPLASPALLPLLFGALLGGLLLNIMPCVFPILSLKAISLARAGESQAHARIEGLAYAAGVVTACAGLGALLLALRAGGEQVGWAFQLQEPGVVAALLLLAVAITANLLGLFEFAVPGFASEGSPQNAFATGLLAAFVATPCTGPFMAAAMGAALLLPVLPAMALFATLGLGIALPFVAIAFVPALRRQLPRPGAWMVRFRRWMAIPMGLTALALVWLASRLGGWNFALTSTAFAIAITGALFAAGMRQRRGRSALAPALCALIIATAGVVVSPLTLGSPEAEAQGVLPSRPFSEAALASARASGKPVFAYFTADWCLTCKVNESVAIEREDVRDTFARAGVTVLRGDWTRRDPAITRYLTAQGAAGVPLYVWYPAGGGAPEQLPQVLSAGMLIDLARPKG